MKDYMDIQLEVLRYEQMVERREDKIKELRAQIKSQESGDLHKFRCWHCKSELIWGGDHDIEDVMPDDKAEGISSNFSCSNYDCHTYVDVHHYFTEDY